MRQWSLEYFTQLTGAVWLRMFSTKSITGRRPTTIVILFFEKDYYWYLSAYIFFSNSPDSLSRQMWPRLSAPTVTMWPLFGFVSSANVPHPEKDLSCILVLLAWRRRFFSVSQIRKSPQQELGNIESQKLRQGKLQRVIQEIPVRNGKTFERLWSSRTL